MKKEELFEAMENIDEYYLKESEALPTIEIKPFGIGKTLAVAAALIVLFGAALILPKMMLGDRISPVDTGELGDTTDTTFDTAIEYGHPTNEEIAAAYEAACEAASWFRESTLGSICGDKSDHILIDGQPYWRVTRFETCDEFDAYLLSLFSDKLAAEFVNSTSAYVGQDGKLYSAPADAGGGLPVSEGRISTIAHEDNDTIAIIVTFNVFDYADTNAIAPTGQIIGNETLLFLYEKIDGKWVFTTFPQIDSKGFYEKYTDTVDNGVTDGLYTFIVDGVNIPLPAEYMDGRYIMIITGQDADNALFVMYHARSEGISGSGEILRLCRYTTVEYIKNFHTGDAYTGGDFTLASDGEYYYVMSVPTDVQVNNLEEYKRYAEIAEACRTAIRENFAAVNGFASVHFDYVGGINILTVDGIKIPVPTDVSGFEDLGFDTDGDALFTLLYKPKDAIRGHGEIYSIYRYTADEYARMLASSSWHPDATIVLATDGEYLALEDEYYYVAILPIDSPYGPTGTVFSEVLFDYFATINGFEAISNEDITSPTDSITITIIDGLKIPAPEKYSSKKYTAFYSDEEALLKLYYAPEHDKSGYGEILRVHRYSAGEYERNFLEGNLYTGGAFALATDKESYYVMSIPTDVQADPTDTEAFKEYGEVAEACRTAIREHFAEVNGFTPINPRDFYDRKYTYDSEHYFVRFYPYGKGTESYYTLVLSQPAKQGEGGIWCVERWLDHHVEEISSLGHIHLTFPDSGDLSALEYYAKLQEEFDNAEYEELASPMSAAKAWAAKIFSNSHIGYFVPSDEQDMPEGEWIY